MIRVVRRLLLGREGQRLVRGLRLFYRLRTEVVLQSEQVGRLAKRTAVRVWIDGTEAFARIERLLRSARHTIIIQMFIWRDDATGQRIAALLLEAADRGVRVSIAKEAVGDVFEFERDFLGTSMNPDGVWKRFWSHPNIDVTHAKHNDHAKVYIIDDHTLLLSGMNITDACRYEWHDYLVELRGSGFVRQYLTGEVPVAGNGQVQLVMNGGTAHGIRSALMRFLEGASSTIVVEHAYLSDQRVIDLLVCKSREGVRVTVVLPEHPNLHANANLLSVARLLSEGARGFLHVVLYPRMVHGKLILVDRTRAFLGSANLITSSIDEMGEVNVLIDSPFSRAIATIRDTLREDIQASRPLTMAPSLWWLGRMLAKMGM
ncbi:MAG: cardiolipin synthase [Candidatus Peregrinibacteria bacterium Gr01-1014_25]|nr:MAG: cardiolipin synthase [Candidatus Peregrinibacteria bacterium Gr01-1014_25]